MSEQTINVKLENPPEMYYPGDTLVATYQVVADPEDVREVEASVLWHTEGKGNEDMGVHFFEKSKPAEEGWQSLREVRRLTTRLPASPLSYHGVIVTIRWCVRVRVFREGGKEWLDEVPFELGEMAAAKEVAK